MGLTHSLTHSRTYLPPCLRPAYLLPTTAWQAALVRLAYPHLWLPPQLDEYTSGVQRWLWPLGVLLLLALLHACYAHAHRLRPALAWALLALACAAHGADATPRSRVCAVLRIDGYSVGSRPLARLCGAAGLALLGLSLYAQACYLTHRQTACIDMLPNHHPIPCYPATAPRHITRFTPYQCSPVYGQCYLVTTPCHAQDLGRGRAGQRTTRNRPQGSRAAGGGGQLTPLTPRGGPERRSRGRSTLLVAEQQEVEEEEEERGWEEEEEEGRRPMRRGSRGCRAVPRHARPYLEEPEPEEEEEGEGAEPEGRRPRGGSRGRYSVPRHSRPYLEGEQAVELVEPTAHSVHTFHSPVPSPQQLVEPTMRRVRVEPVPLPPSRMGVPPAYYGTDEDGPRGDISFRI